MGVPEVPAIDRMPEPSTGPGCKRSDQSFAKEDRLLRRAEFLSATRGGRRYSTRYFLVFLRSNRRGRPRLGTVVSKKVGNAVERNHLKRRIREFYRLHKERLPTSTNFVVVARKGIPCLTYEEVRNDLARFLDGAYLRKPKESRAGRKEV